MYYVMILISTVIYPVPQLNACSARPSDEGCDADGSACLPVDLSVRLRIVDHDGAEQLAARWRRRDRRSGGDHFLFSSVPISTMMIMAMTKS